jgi:hypothetical protein
MGDGAMHVATYPGTETKPSATHLYETKGDYFVSVEVAWGGTYNYRGHGITESGPLGSVGVTSERAYQVVEVRSVLER